MTLQRMAQSALDVQTACNLSGIVRSFAEITASMRADHGFDTRTCNAHPICKLFAVQIAHLTGQSCDAINYSDWYHDCEVLAGIIVVSEAR